MRLYDASGNPLTAATQIAAPLVAGSLTPTDPHIAMDDSGNFVVIYTIPGTPIGTSDIAGRRFAADGTPLGGEFLVNNLTADSQFYPDVAMDADGDFVVSWFSFVPSIPQTQISVRRYDNTGTAQGLEFQVDTPPGNGTLWSEVGIDAVGNFIVVWDEFGADGDVYGILGRRYDNTGTPLTAEFLINTYTVGTQARPAVDMNRNGDFVVTWQSIDSGFTDGVSARRYNAAGVPQGAEFQVNTYLPDIQTDPEVDLDPNGNFIISWVSTNQDSSPNSVYAQLYDASGTPQGGEFIVSPYVPEVDSDPEPEILALDNFIITFMGRNHPGGDDDDVYFVRFGDVPPVTPTPVINNPTTATNNSLAVFDPSISKIGFLTPGQLGVTGEQLEWVITVTNNGSTAGTNVVISDTLRSELRIDRVQTSKGTSSVNGQTVTINIPSLAPNESVQISVFTTVLSGVNIDNTACVRADNLNGERCATGRAVRSLPSTGETPIRHFGLWILLGALTVALMWRRRLKAGESQ
jgi:uncharacterized repeat protein (TIGR01451 family)